MAYRSIYFRTAIILNWSHLLPTDAYKDVIVGSLQHLSKRRLVDVFGFVIMPNHVHLIWGPQWQGNAAKYIPEVHRASIQKALIAGQEPEALWPYEVLQEDRQYSFWQLDPMAIHLYSRAVAEQKLNYTHFNPTTERWRLAVMPEEYSYSSARYYGNGDDRFPF